MALPANLDGKLRIPLIGAPMFIVSGPELVLAQCKAGIVGSFPALNARPESMLEEWLQKITTELAEFSAKNPGLPVAPFAVNQIVHKSNDRLGHDVEMCVRYKVPIVITSLRPPADVVDAVHSYGGIVFHDVINLRHTEKALEQGVDGIIAVCAGAGGHAGTTSPFALIKEIRRIFDGALILSGSMSRGCDLVAARAIGADLAYFGTRFIATTEANAPAKYKEMIVNSNSADIVYTPLFTGVHGSYLRGSIEAAGLDPDNLDQVDTKHMNFGSGGNSRAKAWRDIWGAGQGVGTIDEILPVHDVVMQIEREYRDTLQRVTAA
ncbi:MAG: nitronate monooxygenase family protein [Gammaproteobacteria bacterium]|nr:nitronate monooxygenase family protein [Gammaproteobacteria bacterium]MDH4313685.1 nitronate monooxygenase family protein [Gammaproteobacteria bacterium]MDH5214598.1 nitronate monooxygenase family protein [Gammaproteobacteria bacterium]MDH5500753.1 nitronate monooxygenase family protein [Gammaproteobacteria bacterium]